ncbi:hypothetical protein FACS1894145_2960 [Bacteroidia bacterium]|nr:hypothetical protein FACS1894145_2960 [Bacteroidia bacterium]
MEKKKSKRITLPPHRRTSQAYTVGFKIQVVREIEQGALTIALARRKYSIYGGNTLREWIKKYGIFAKNQKTKTKMMQTPQQKIAALEQKLRQMERQNKFLEEQVVAIEDKAGILDKIIELAEKEYHLSIRKNYKPDQSARMAKSGKKR